MTITIGTILTGRYFTGNIEVTGIYETDNELKVKLTKDNSVWLETWNLEHTISGLNQGEYRILCRQ